MTGTGIPTTYSALANFPGHVLCAGSFRPNGASGIVTGSVKGNGFTVARTSIGLYTVTFDRNHSFPKKVSVLAAMREADGRPGFVTGGDYSESERTIQLRAWRSSSASYAGSKGYIPIDITAAREIAANDIQALAAHGGLLAVDSVPDLYRENAATDKALRVEWKAGEQDEIQFPPIAWPPDLDPTADVSVHLMVSKSGNVDNAAVIGVNAFEGIGDTNMGGDTAALATAAITEYFRVLAHADIAGHPGMLNLALIPGVHANDAVRLHAAWVEYQKTSLGTFNLVDLAADVDNEISFAVVVDNDLVAG